MREKGEREMVKDREMEKKGERHRQTDRERERGNYQKSLKGSKRTRETD